MSSEQTAAKRQRLVDSNDSYGRVQSLLQRLIRSVNEPSSIGSFTPVVYDTAWLAMVTKEVGGRQETLFPECFKYLLDNQQEDGSWVSYASDVDGILNTAASLLALFKYHSRQEQSDAMHSEIEKRISQASKALQVALMKWDVESTVHVGFEILVPRILEYLEPFGAKFEFPGRESLMQSYSKKMAKFDPKMLYSGHQSTILHSLEGFIGLINFDHVSCHLSPLTGIMGSPASTSAFIMNTSDWNETAESYLSSVVQAYEGSGVPSAFPTTVFDVSWALTVLNDNGFEVGTLSAPEVSSLAGYLRKALDENGGTVGFAPGLLSDADDTAKTISTFQKLGQEADVSPLIKAFETENHFRTYKLEKNPSVSANCNVLLALLGSDNLSPVERCVFKAVKFLINLWDEGPLDDKWNLAQEYSFMALTDALTTLLERWNDGQLSSEDSQLMTLRVPTVLCQLASKILLGQAADGSWRQSLEVTAYAVISLSKLSSLPWASEIQYELDTAIKHGKRYLSDNDSLWAQPSFLWIEKVTYGSSLLSELYCVAASQVTPKKRQWGNQLVEAFTPHPQQSAKMIQLFQSLPLFAEVSSKMIHLAVAESRLYDRRLREFRLDVFSNRDDSMTADKYLKFIPLAWIATKYLVKPQIAERIAWEMMIISMLNYQADEYVESTVSKLAEKDLTLLEAVIRKETGLDQDEISTSDQDLKRDFQDRKKPKDHPLSPMTPPLVSEGDGTCSIPRIHEFKETLQKFIRYVLLHPNVTESPFPVRRLVAEELYGYLTAQITHNRQNAKLAKKKVRMTSSTDRSTTENASFSAEQHIFMDVGQSFFDWSRTVGANDTSCPYSFAFFCCLISRPGAYCLFGARRQYIGSALCRNLAAMCRQYNDYGSLRRDQEEGNLNSLNFADFSQHEGSAESHEGSPSDMHILEDAKAELLEIANFEKSYVHVALDQLQQLVPHKTFSALKTFINVTDLFGQIYVVRDIASRVKRS